MHLLPHPCARSRQLTITNNARTILYLFQFVWRGLLGLAMFPISWRLHRCSHMLIFLSLFVVVSRTNAKDAWERPGCHKVGMKAVSICDSRNYVTVPT